MARRCEVCGRRLRACDGCGRARMTWGDVLGLGVLALFVREIVKGPFR